MHKMKAAAIGTAIALTVYLGLSIFGAINVMEIPRLPLTGSPASVGLTYEDVSFTSRGDSVVLKGWYITGERDFIIIIVHGGFQNRVDLNVDTLGLARDLAAKGYGLLLFDLRGRGESEGKGLSLSNIERDIGGAVDYLKSKGCPTENIGIIGFCSGAASSCIFASQEDIGALVLDGCFSSVTNMFIREAAERGIPKFLVNTFIPGVFLMAKIIYGYDLVNPVDVVSHVDCPILFIHEEYDDLISIEDTYRLYNASGNPANKIWEVRSTEHSQAYKMHPSIYVEKVTDLFSTREKEIPH